MTTTARRLILAFATLVPPLAGCDSNSEAPTAPRPGDSSIPPAKASPQGALKGVEPVPAH